MENQVKNEELVEVVDFSEILEDIEEDGCRPAHQED